MQGPHLPHNEFGRLNFVAACGKIDARKFLHLMRRGAAGALTLRPVEDGRPDRRHEPTDQAQWNDEKKPCFTPE